MTLLRKVHDSTKIFYTSFRLVYILSNRSDVYGFLLKTRSQGDEMGA